MRFLYVAPRYHTNQVPIIRGLKRKGNEVCFLSQYAGKVEDYSDLTPTVIGYSGIFLFFDRIYMALMKKKDAYAGDRKMKCGFPPIGKLKRAIRDSHADVAILRERSVYSICAYLICRKYKIPTILYNQSPLWEDCIKNDPAHRLMRLLTPRVRMTPVMGVQEAGKVKEPGAAFVPFVMEPEQKADEKNWTEDGITHIFSIGKYEERKNHRMMVEVVEELSAVSRIHLTIAGERTTPAHQAYYDRLKGYIDEHGLQDKVTLLVNLNRQQVAEQYRKADLFVIPSTREPASISQLEAMAFSLPVVCGDKNGTACYVENGVNGWQFRDNQKAFLKEALEKMVGRSEILQKMGQESYRLILEKYQIENYLEGIEKLLTELGEER